jgi:hypothetical protein
MGKFSQFCFGTLVDEPPSSDEGTSRNLTLRVQRRTEAV